jgi:hypothetical protein
MRTQKIFQVAREIGVDSKAIIARCKAENVPNIDNHLSVVSSDLAANIRRWFSTTASIAVAEQPEQPEVGNGKKSGARNTDT